MQQDVHKRMAWLDNIPAELKALPQWCFSSTEQKPDGSYVKVPRNPSTGGKAMVNTPATWGTYEQALAMWQAHPDFVLGIGFVFTAEDPYVVVDLDNKPEKPASPSAIGMFDYIVESTGTYVETSISGMGKHAILRDDFKGKGAKAEGLEVYGAARYMLLTGNVPKAGPSPISIAEDPDAVTKLAETLSNRGREDGGTSEGLQWGNVQFDDSNEPRTDAEILAAFQNFNPQMYEVLYVNGDSKKWAELKGWEGGDDRSGADFALAQALVRVCPNDERVLKLFYASDLDPGLRKQRGYQPKGDNYLRYTIGRARLYWLKFEKAPLLDFTAFEANVLAKRAAEQQADEEQAKAAFERHTPPAPPVPSPPPVPPVGNVAPPPPLPVYSGDFPPGLVGRIAQRILQTSVRPIPELAVHAAFAYMAGICGRGYNVNGMGLALFALVSAPSGIGKESMTSGISQLNYHVRKINNRVDEYFDVPGSFSSDVALKQHLADHPCGLSIQTEFGKTLMKLNNAKDVHAEGLKAGYMACFTKGDYHSRVTAHKTANKDTTTGHVFAPNLSILAEGTPETIFPNLTVDNVTEGLMGRFLLVDYNGEKPLRNARYPHPPDPGMVQTIADIIAIANMNEGKILASSWDTKEVPVTIVKLDPDAAAYELELDNRMTRDFNINRGDIVVKLSNRFNMLLFKVAALIAIGENHIKPTITLSTLKWAEAYVRKCTGFMIDKFKTGELGGNELTKRESVVLAAAKRYIVDGPSKSMASGDTDALRKAYSVPYDYLRRMVREKPEFGEDGKFSRTLLQMTLAGLAEAGLVKQVEKKHAKERFNVENAWLILNPEV